MNLINKSAAVVALVVVMTLGTPAAALAYYPYTWFTGTSNFYGPDVMVGAGGFSTGPLTAYSAGVNYYGSSDCSAQYGCGSIGYNAMTGQGSGAWAGNTTNYGSQYGYGSSYSNWQQYVPANAQQYVSGYGYGMNSYGSGYGGYSGYSGY